MNPTAPQDQQKLLTEVIKKQIVILGPDITLAKARNVAGLTVSDDGTVTALAGNPQEITQKLIEQFMELSGLIVKKTMEPLLASQAAMAAQAMGPALPAAPAPSINPAAVTPPPPPAPAPGSIPTPPAPVGGPPPYVPPPAPAPGAIPTSPSAPVSPAGGLPPALPPSEQATPNLTTPEKT